MPTMKFYTTPGIPNPDVVHFYAEEAGCAHLFESIPINVGKGENRTPEFYKLNPLGEVPALVMDDGSCLSESIAIAKFLDDSQGFTSLVGTTPIERAEVDMWLLRCEQKVLEPIGSAFRNGPMFNFFKDRRVGYIHAEHVDGMKIAGQTGLKWLNEELVGKTFLCGDRFTLADIRLYCLYAFYTKADSSQKAPAELSNFNAYISRIAARPAATAIKPKKKKSNL